MISSFFKNFFDLIFSCFLIVALSPVFVLISILIFLDDGMPIIFIQKRIGKLGKLFQMYKFRTMRRNSEQLETGYYCFEGDKRITKVGKILRTHGQSTITIVCLKTWYE